MLVNSIVGALIAAYAVFVIFSVIKKRRDAKKNGKQGCPFCSGGSCAGCEKKDRACFEIHQSNEK